MFIFFSLSFPRGKEEKRSKRERKAKEKQNNKKHVSMCCPQKPLNGSGFLCRVCFHPKTQIRPPIEAEFG